MHLMVLGASRPLGVLSVVPPGETGPGSPPARKRPLDRAAHRSLNQALPSSRKGHHRRACRGSAPPEVDVGMRIPGGPCRVLPIPARRCGPRTGRPWPVGRRAGVVPGLGAPGVPPFSEATTILPQGSWWPGTVGVVRCYCPCMRDRVVSMEIASLTRRPRVRVTDVMGSEPIVWNSLSVKLPAGA